MIQGMVLASGEATVRVTIRGIAGRAAQVEAMVDTGFNDEMTLPPRAIEKLGLKFVSASNYTLADGVKSAARVFEGEIEWHGAWQQSCMSSKLRAIRFWEWASWRAAI